jgi:unsaturated chondroitin disaccharide hydrolase
MQIDRHREPADLLPRIERVFDVSAGKLLSIEDTWRPDDGAPVFTVAGQYRARGWTEWTQGFQFGSAILQLDMGRGRTLERMAPHLTHMGVHDHGFNNVSTYGNLWRLGREGRIEASDWEMRFYELALKVSGAVQAHRWTRLPKGGFIHSFNGAHSLFVDTIRSLRALALGHVLGQRLMEEQDANISLLDRLLDHAHTTAQYNVYFGRDRDRYDVRGRTAHESLFNVASGTYRGPSTQQGYSPFSTWTRGLAWAMLGFAEQLEFLATLREEAPATSMLLEAAIVTCDHYIDDVTATDGIPYWDAGAPGLALLPDWRERPSDPTNPHEPVDSSAAAIAAQGLLRLARILDAAARQPEAELYRQAGLRVTETLFEESGPYLSTDPKHQGLILHSVYHWPNRWDHVPEGATTPRGESSQWGDYHARELALYVKRLAEEGPYLAFYGPEPFDSAQGRSNGGGAR